MSKKDYICKWCGIEKKNGLSLGGHMVNCSMYPGRDSRLKKISNSSKNRKHTDETKEKISKVMIQRHLDGVAWNIGRSRWNNEPSYPEKFFAIVIENEFHDKNYISEYPIGRFSLDFAWSNKKLAIEIDGEQHFRCELQKDRDYRKNKICSELGWKILRIRWIDMFKNPKEYIEIAKKFIGD